MNPLERQRVDLVAFEAVAAMQAQDGKRIKAVQDEIHRMEPEVVFALVGTLVSLCAALANKIAPDAAEQVKRGVVGDN